MASRAGRATVAPPGRRTYRCVPGATLLRGRNARNRGIRPGIGVRQQGSGHFTQNSVRGTLVGSRDRQQEIADDEKSLIASARGERDRIAQIEGLHLGVAQKCEGAVRGAGVHHAVERIETVCWSCAYCRCSAEVTPYSRRTSACAPRHACFQSVQARRRMHSPDAVQPPTAAGSSPCARADDSHTAIINIVPGNVRFFTCDATRRS